MSTTPTTEHFHECFLSFAKIMFTELKKNIDRESISLNWRRMTVGFVWLNWVEMVANKVLRTLTRENIPSSSQEVG